MTYLDLARSALSRGEKSEERPSQTTAGRCEVGSGCERSEICEKSPAINDVAVGLTQVSDFHGSHCVHLLVNLDVAPACVWAPPLMHPANPAPPRHVARGPKLASPDPLNQGATRLMIDFSNLAVMVPFVPPARAARPPEEREGWGSGAVEK